VAGKNSPTIFRSLTKNLKKKPPAGPLSAVCSRTRLVDRWRGWIAGKTAGKRKMANCPRNENTVPLSFYWNALFAALPTIRQVIASTPPPITPPTTGTILVRLIMPFSPAFVKSLNPTISLILTSRDRESCSITLYVILLDAEAPKGFVVLLNRHIKCFLTLHNISCLKTVIHKGEQKTYNRSPSDTPDGCLCQIIRSACASPVLFML